VLQEGDRTDPNLQSDGLRSGQLKTADSQEVHDNITMPWWASDVKTTVGRGSLDGTIDEIGITRGGTGAV